MTRVLILLLLALITGFSATADACYHEAEAEAEQGLRIHSELMVIGLTCMKMPGGDNLYSKYRKFTQNNAAVISKYENEIIDYYSNEGYSDPEEALHSLRTTMANNISEYAVEISVLTFCEVFSERLNVVEDLSSDEFIDWARFSIEGNPTSEPKCEFD